MFWKDKPVLEVNPTLEQQIRKLSTRVELLEGETLALTISMDSMRNKVLRKIQQKHPIEEEDKPKDLYSGMFIKE